MRDDYFRQEINKSKSKKYYLPCLSCSVHTNHGVLFSLDINEFIPYIHEYWEEYQIIQCLGCETICFRKTYKNTENTIIQNGKEIPSEIEDLYPSRIIGRKKIKNLQLLPYLVLKVYEETFSAFTNNLRILTGIGIRTLIEAICIERKATGRNLLEKIHNLVSMGILSKDNSEVLHSIRVFGNEVVHEIDIPSEDLLSITMDIVENLLQSTYILPHLKEKLHKRKDIPF